MEKIRKFADGVGVMEMRIGQDIIKREGAIVIESVRQRSEKLLGKNK